MRPYPVAARFFPSLLSLSRLSSNEPRRQISRGHPAPESLGNKIRRLRPRVLSPSLRLSSCPTVVLNAIRRGLIYQRQRHYRIPEWSPVRTDLRHRPIMDGCFINREAPRWITLRTERTLRTWQRRRVNGFRSGLWSRELC